MCIGNWCYVMDSYEEEQTVEDIPIVCNFKDVVPEELAGLPPQREIDFEIELVPSAQPIFKAHSRMAPTEIRELKIQLDELLQKEFIRPSVSS